MLQLHFVRLAIAGLLVLAALALAPEFFTEPFPALGAGLLAFLVSWPVYKWVKKRFFRPIIMFDMHGVYFTGDLALENFSPMPGMPELVEELRKNYCVVAFTNMSPELFSFWNGKWGITSRFDYTFVSGKIRAKKPDPQAFKIIARQLGVKPSDVVFFDDLLDNVKGAASIGIEAVHFQNTGQAMNVLRKMGVKV